MISYVHFRHCFGPHPHLQSCSVAQARQKLTHCVADLKLMMLLPPPGF